MNTFRNSKDYERCLKILSLSYNNLPIHLKPCLLYLRFYPEDSKIGISKLTKLWIAEGFLKPIRGKSLEEAAEIYLRDLIDRNLIISLKFGYDGKIKTCGIHDLLRDLCLREYGKEHFVYVPKVQHVIVGSRMNDEDCFLCGFTSTLQRMDLNEVHDASQLTSVASVLVCNRCRNMYPRLNKTRLVRVKLVKPIKWYGESSEEEILHPTTLRYLETHNLNNLELYSPSSIIFVWNQEIVHMYSYSTNTLLLPSKFWYMTQLRHLNASNVVLPDPAVTQDSIIMENLQSLYNIRNFRCTEEVLKRIPNLKKLGVSFYEEKRGIDWSYYCLYNLVRLQKLESLSIKGKDLSLENLTFPTSLKKLSLNACNIPWEKMTTIGSLMPNLERLKLEANTFDGQEWNQVEGEFPRLKVLKIYHNVHLKWWRAEKIHFPNLESLILRLMFKLLEIPSVIGDIPTLHSISVQYCNDSLIDSAKQILEEQRGYGNESLQLYIDEKRYQVGSS
ncbi:UNVERIFIED_CONTAM: putative disease resistance RPP8-like protein 2 [Sesamum radiatum]|uniref:Disease resistance RPP8-like protein 2 n=1 Tax=Sesamum radiatum TaxID=300843 RepID=A0AAW2WGF6_SESRA